MLYRFNIQLAIPEQVFDGIPLARTQALRDEIRALKALSVKINEGLPNEEDITIATWHKCYHDEGKSCEPIQEI